jgi:Protein of unknown function (DUF3987)
MPGINDRELPDWLSSFMQSADYGEAPPYFYFWTGVATIAAALRRRVWLDMGTFTWYPNLYTLLVAPPGIVQKSSTSDLGMRLLKKIPTIFQGPTTLTWQALYDAYLEVGEEFPISPTEVATQSALYVNSPEFGITLNPKDTEMIDQLVHIWDGAAMRKRTRKDGEVVIPTPCLNLIACTTPSWIAENVPQYLIGGGLTSRILFVYGEEKVRYVAYPQLLLPANYTDWQAALVRDLERISTLVGGFSLTPDAYSWGQEWYEDFHKNQAPKLDKTLIGGYIARKQTLVHKVAMILAVSRGDSLIIDRDLLERAMLLITELEDKMPMVYGRIGMKEGSNSATQVLAFLERNDGQALLGALYRYMHKTYPDVSEFEKILVGMIQAGMIVVDKATKMVRKV